MWKFSSNHMPPGAGAFCSSNIARYEKHHTPCPQHQKGWQHLNCIHPWSLPDQEACDAEARGLSHPFSHWTSTHLTAKKCHSSCPVAPMPAVLANRPQRLSPPFNHRSCSFLVSVVVVPAQAFIHVIPGLRKTWSCLPCNTKFMDEETTSACQVIIWHASDIVKIPTAVNIYWLWNILQLTHYHRNKSNLK